MLGFNQRLILILLWCMTLMGVLPAYAHAEEPVPVNIEADEMSHDERTKLVTARGHVEVVQGKQVLNADELTYNIGTDKIMARGHVTLLDNDGNKHQAEEMAITSDLKEGLAKKILTMTTDGATFTAESAVRQGGNKTTMKNASYTPCKVCEETGRPLWQIKADKVVHNQAEKSVDYKNARLEMFGVPMIYSPILSHPDPSVTRKSGFLRPDYGYSSDIGTHVEMGYYFGDIAPDMDATLWVRPTTLAGTLVQGEWRQRFEKGRLQLNPSFVKSDRHEEDGRVEEDRWRGSIFGQGLYEVNDLWRAGFNLERASDKEYLRLYNLERTNVLESEVYAERFENRDYTRVSAMNFQDIRLGLRPEQPDVMPQIEHRMYGAPQGLLGGRWTIGAGALGLQRNGEDQDVQRVSFDAGWERRDVANNGIVVKSSVVARTDGFMAQDKDAATLTPNGDKYANAFRAVATADVTVSYPMVKRMSDALISVEPVAGITATPQINNTENRISNEDSIDVQLDDLNLFSDNRFPGIDRIEDGVRANYGLRMGVHGDNGRYVKGFLGQSYRFSDEAALPVGSGLEENVSDIVGSLSVGLSRYINADYRFQIDTEQFKPMRHELMGRGGNDTFSANIGYIFLSPVAGTGFTETREQILLGGEYHMNDRWWLNALTLTDLGEEPGLRRAVVGLNYRDECFNMTLQGARNLATEASGESGTTVLMRIGFKNIGEFTTPRIQFDQQPGAFNN